MEFKNACANCKYFRQHYIKRGKTYISIDYGHCTHIIAKSKRSEFSLCPHYKENPKKAKD